MSILAGPQSPSVSELQDLGVARVSYGSGFTKAAITGAKQLAQEILEKGTCNLLKDGMQTPEITALVSRKSSRRAMNSKSVVVSLHIAPGAALPMQTVSEVLAVAGRGLPGDRYFDGKGTYSNHPGSGREVTLIESEALDGIESGLWSRHLR